MSRLDELELKWERQAGFTFHYSQVNTFFFQKLSENRTVCYEGKCPAPRFQMVVLASLKFSGSWESVDVLEQRSSTGGLRAESGPLKCPIWPKLSESKRKIVMIKATLTTLTLDNYQ